MGTEGIEPSGHMSCGGSTARTVSIAVYAPIVAEGGGVEPPTEIIRRPGFRDRLPSHTAAPSRKAKSPRGISPGGPLVRRGFWWIAYTITPPTDAGDEE